MTTHRADHLLGRQLAAYTIEELLGEGGFAFVYRARDRNLDIDVALKVLKPAFAYDQTFEQNFRREAHRAAKFRHPNVIAIHYAGKEEDVVFFSMDLLEKGLAERMRHGPAPEDLIIRVAGDVASALQFAHTFEGGIIHRDLKPDNILFDRHGNAVVTDFGIAEAATSYTAATGTTVFVGTPKYMSPEQARGLRLDHRSDIYSLGVTLYEMAVGEPPFAGRDWFELGRKHIEQLPALPRERNPAIRPELERIILKCLQKNPADRYQSAQEIRDELMSLNGAAAPTLVLPDGEPGEPNGRAAEGPLAGARRRPRGAASATGAKTAPPERAVTPVDAGRGGLLRHLLLGAGLLLAGAAAAYHFDLGGFQGAAERRMPAIANLPIVGSGRVYARPPTYRVVEGGADVAGAIVVPFTGPIDPATATSANVHLIGPDSFRVTTQVALSADGRSLIVQPADSLRYAARYTLAIVGGIRSRRGVPVLTDPEAVRRGVRFTVGTRPPPPDALPPRVAASVPTGGAEEAAGDAPLQLTFTEPLDPASVDSAALTLRNELGDAVPVELFWKGDFRIVEVRPRSALTPGAGYVLQIDSTLTDRAGNPLIADSVPFRTAGAASAAGPARLDVRVVPGDARYVSVVIDGDTLGPPPIRGYRVRADRRHTVEILGIPEFSAHAILLHRSQHAPAAGQSRAVTAEIEPFGSISVNSEPVGTVYIDGEAVGRVPLAGYPLMAGRRHALEIRPLAPDEADYRPYSVEVEVRPYEWKILGRVRLPQRRPSRP